MRGSRTLSMPVPMRYLSLAGLTRNIFRNSRSDHPSVTLALIPSAPSRKRTARTDRPRRRAIFFTGSYPANLNNFSSSSAVHGLHGRPPDRSSFQRFLRLVWVARLRNSEFGFVPQLLDASPTVLARPMWDKLKDSVDCFALLDRPLLNRSDQQMVDCRQRPRVGLGLATILFPTITHRSTSLWAIRIVSLLLAT